MVGLKNKKNTEPSIREAGDKNKEI